MSENVNVNVEVKDDYGSIDWLHRPLNKCPICKKEFLPASQHMYKIRYRNKNGYDRVAKVCSYNCMRKWEKKIEAAKKEKEAKKNG